MAITQTPVPNTPVNVQRDKQQARAALKQQRRALPAAHRRQASESLATHLRATAAWQAARVVGLYLPLATELDPGGLIVSGEEKCWVYPRVTGPSQMSFHPLGSEIEIGPGNVRQPDGSLPETPYSEIDLLVIPLLGCDPRGMRLGYGGGYYDRVLPKVVGLKVGVGFQIQRLENPIATESHDQGLDWFASEEGVEVFSG